MLFGASQTTANGIDNLIVRTDTNGNVRWKKTFGDSSDEICAHAIRTRNGDFVAQGTSTSYNNGFIDWSMMRIDSTGSLLWYKTYGIAGNNSGADNFIQESDGSFVIAGYTHVGFENHDMVVLKTDSAGNMLWSKRYPLSSNELAQGIAKASNGDYIIIGTSTPYNSTSSWIYLLRIDHAGNVKWAKQYTSTDVTQPYLWGNNVMMLPDGNMILQGVWGTAPSTNTSGFFIKADSNGNVLWSRTYVGSTTSFGADLNQSGDGGLVVAGSTTNLGSKGGYDCLLLKTTDDGSVYSTGIVSLSTSSLNITAVNAGFSTASHNLTVQSGQFLRSGNGFTQSSLLPDTTKVLSIWDVPNDNGKHVFIRWRTTASPISLGMTGFDLYRNDQNAWTYIKGNIPVLNDTVYQVIAPTLYDSTIMSGMHWSVFRVIAHTSNPSVYTTIGPDSGYSVDNMPPQAPITGSIIDANGNTTIRWYTPVDTNSGFMGYNVYRGTTPTFIPSSQNKIAFDIDTFYVDNTAQTNTRDLVEK